MTGCRAGSKLKVRPTSTRQFVVDQEICVTAVDSSVLVDDLTARVALRGDQIDFLGIKICRTQRFEFDLLLVDIIGCCTQALDGDSDPVCIRHRCRCV